jgi:hypothetical protein
MGPLLYRHLQHRMMLAGLAGSVEPRMELLVLFPVVRDV